MVPYSGHAAVPALLSTVTTSASSPRAPLFIVNPAGISNAKPSSERMVVPLS